jgi:DNA invertase Pin-like site-specific DNA recombinase
MTKGAPLIPAAQYLRMSTEHQRYSIENQSYAIQKYAELHGFAVSRTYTDTAKSGLVLKRRSGLKQLLRDVVAGSFTCKAILVYDVSRWGRFQDTDESAHYEFLCKSAGVPVHYCAETFVNDGSLPSLVMKALKRAMAGEYSRELGVKVHAGLKRLAELGFKQGGMPGYGLRRMLISADGQHKQPLGYGERKSIATDRVILVPGPAHETQVIRSIYRMFIEDGFSVYRIAQELKRKGIKHCLNSAWTRAKVHNVLSHPQYAGCHVFNRTSCRLQTRVVRLPKSDWILTPGAIEPLIDAAVFDEAQKIMRRRSTHKSDEELLNILREVLLRDGKITSRRLKNSLGTPSPSSYISRFGSLRRAYELVGYYRADEFAPYDFRNRVQVMREDLLRQIADLFPGEVSVVRRGRRWRSRLRLRSGLIVSVLIARSFQTLKQAPRWRIDPALRECRHVSLVARLDIGNDSFLDFRIFPHVDRRVRFELRPADPWLDRGAMLNELSEFGAVVKEVQDAKKRGALFR